VAEELEQQPEKLTRNDWIVIAVGLLLVVDLIAFPWLETSATAGSNTVTTTTPATGGPKPLLGVLAVLAVLVLIADLVTERRAPALGIPAIAGSRATNRAVLALAAALFIVLKFLLHVSFSEFRWGFYFSLVVAAAFVFVTLAARAEEPRVQKARRRRLEEQERREREESSDEEPKRPAG
jgi:hypothetical protein